MPPWCPPRPATDRSWPPRRAWCRCASTSRSRCSSGRCGCSPRPARAWTRAVRRIRPGTRTPSRSPVGSGLGRGTYTVAWHVISADSHPVSGAFTFSVGTSSATSVSQVTVNAAGSRSVGVLYGIARGTAYGGFALMAGATAFLLCCWPPGAASRRVRVLIGGGWAALVVATSAVLGLQGPYDGGLGLGRVLRQRGAAHHARNPARHGAGDRLLLLGLFGVGLALMLPRCRGRRPGCRVTATAAGAAPAVGIAATWAGRRPRRDRLAGRPRAAARRGARDGDGGLARRAGGRGRRAAAAGGRGKNTGGGAGAGDPPVLDHRSVLYRRAGRQRDVSGVAPGRDAGRADRDGLRQAVAGQAARRSGC